MRWRYLFISLIANKANNPIKTNYKVLCRMLDIGNKLIIIFHYSLPFPCLCWINKISEVKK